MAKKSRMDVFYQMLEAKVGQDKVAEAKELMQTSETDILAALLKLGHISKTQERAFRTKIPGLKTDQNIDTVPETKPEEEPADSIYDDPTIQPNTLDLESRAITGLQTGFERRPRYDEDRYVVEKKLGQGGMGIVEKARDRNMEDMPVAVKQILAQEIDPRKEERFLKEQKAGIILAGIPQVCRALDRGYDSQGNLRLVAEFVNGVEFKYILDEVRQRNKTRKYPLPLVLGYLAEIARGMQKAHEKGVLHRDLKPANVMIDQEGQVKIMDWGLAKIGGETEKSRVLRITGKKGKSKIEEQNLEMTKGQHMTLDGVAMGTPPYMSREQVENAAKVDHRADVYSLGAMLYEALTGIPPHDWVRNEKGEVNINMTLLNIKHEEIAPINAVPEKPYGEVDEDIQAIAMKAISDNPKKRYQTAQAFAEDIEAYLARQPVKARPRGMLERIGNFINNHKLVSGLSATVLAGAIGGIFSYQTIEMTAAQRDAAEAKAKEEAKTRKLAEKEKILAEKDKELAVEKADKAEREKEIERKNKEIEKQGRELAELKAAAAEREVEGQSASLNTLDSLKFLKQDEGYYEAALARINIAITQSENFWKPYLTRAKHQATFGKHEQAEADFEKAQEMFRQQHKEESVEIWFEAGMYYGLPCALGGRGLEDRALQYFEKASAAKPNDAFGQLAKAVALVVKSRQDPEKAEEWLPEAIETAEILTVDTVAKSIDATWLVYAWMLAASLFEEYNYPVFQEHADFSEARDALLHVTDGSQGDAGILNFLALVYHRLGEHDKAITILSNILRFIKADTYYINRGAVYHDAGDFGKALKDFNDAVILNQKSKSAHYNIGVTYYHTGKSTEALKSLDKCIELDPTFTAAYRVQGYIYNSKNSKTDFETAIRIFTKAIDLDKKNGLNYNGRADSYIGLRMFKEAEADLRIAMSMNCDISFITWGECLMKQGEYAKAEQAFRDATTKVTRPEYKALIERNMQELKKLKGK